MKQFYLLLEQMTAEWRHESTYMLAHIHYYISVYMKIQRRIHSRYGSHAFTYAKEMEKGDVLGD